jgi:trehalose 6-phosphate synthase
MIDALGNFGGLVLAANTPTFESDYADFDYKTGKYLLAENKRGGGVVSALNSPMQALGDRAIYVALGTSIADSIRLDERGYIKVPPNEKSQYWLRRVFPPESDREGYYEGYSNGVLWPCSHEVGVEPVLGQEYEGFWGAYYRVNSSFASSVIEAFVDIKTQSGSDPLIMVNDYHLMLVPRRIEEVDEDGYTRDAVKIYFHHIPFPSWEMFSKLPHGKEITEGLLASDITGFHTDGYLENFLRYARNTWSGEEIRIEEKEIDGKPAAVISFRGKDIYTTKFPIGIDADKHRNFAKEGIDGLSAANKYIEGGFPEDGILLLAVSRFDYTKGMEKEINALERFLEENSEYAGRVRMLHVLSPTRLKVPDYKKYNDDINNLAKETNDRLMARYGTKPITLYTTGMTHEELGSLYRFADVFLVSALRDGMNLTPFEYGASQLTGERDKTGVVVLSEFTGAKDVIGDNCIVIKPYDTPGFSRAIKEAIEIPPERKKEMMRGIQESVWGNTANDWMADMFEFAWKVKEIKSR